MKRKEGETRKEKKDKRTKKDKRNWEWEKRE